MKIAVCALLQKVLALALPLAALAAIEGCSQPGRSTKENNVVAVSQTPPKLEPLPPAVKPKPTRARVASQGDCAPRYAGGGTGTCINSRPCRGFGVRGEDKKAICTCYGRDGGCGEGQRCDPLALRCVPEKTPPFGRAASH